MAVRCPSCGWKTQRVKSTDAPGGYGTCTQSACEQHFGMDRVLRPLKTLAERRFEKAQQELKQEH